MKKRGVINRLFFGILGGLILFALDTIDIYNDVSYWMYILGFVFITILPMLWFRYKNKQESTFVSLIKVGLYNFLIALFVSIAATFMYTYKYLSHEDKHEIIDKKVAHDIMTLDTSSIYIFALDNVAYNTVNPNISEVIIIHLFSIPLYLLICIILALILKPKIELGQGASKINAATTNS